MPYIDRDAIPYFFTEDGSRLVAFKDFVDKVPDANVEPIKTAEWIPIEKFVPDWGANIIHHYECSNCKILEYTNDRKYCSNCGAKIVGRR